jgi:hypothetical protein
VDGEEDVVMFASLQSDASADPQECRDMAWLHCEHFVGLDTQHKFSIALAND